MNNNERMRIFYLLIGAIKSLNKLLDGPLPSMYTTYSNFFETLIMVKNIYCNFDGFDYYNYHNFWNGFAFVEKLTILFEIYNEIYIKTTILCKQHNGSNKFWKEIVSYMEEMVPLLMDTTILIDEKCITAMQVNRQQMYNDMRWMNVRDVIMASQLSGNNILYAIPSELTKHICEFVQ
jgi:hypothetical protein